MNSSLFKNVFPRPKPIIAMLHVFTAVPHVALAQALGDLIRLEPLVDGVIVENYGSGFNAANASRQLAIAGGAIVGSALKRHGVKYGEPIDRELTVNLMAEVKKYR